MSDEITRNTRSIRFKKDYCKIRKQLALAKAYRVPVTEKQIHRLAKLKVLNCGDPNCIMCGNPRKVWRGKTEATLTIQERRHNQQLANEEIFEVPLDNDEDLCYNILNEEFNGNF